MNELQELEVIPETGRDLGDVEVAQEVDLEKRTRDILHTVVDVMILEKGGDKDQEVVP